MSLVKRLTEAALLAKFEGHHDTQSEPDRKKLNPLRVF